MLKAATSDAPNRLAVICGPDRLRYRDYWACIAALAHELHDMGVVHGDRVATLLANSADAAIATFGVQASGAQLVPLNPSYTPAELKPVLADAAPRAVLCDRAIEDRVRSVIPAGVPIIAIGEGARRLTMPAALFAELPFPALPTPDWLSTLQYTGGTTGVPKGVNLTHGSTAANVAQREAAVPTLDGERVMCITPLFHVYAVSMGLYLAANCRGTLYIEKKFDADSVHETIARERITFLSASPTILLGLMRAESFPHADFGSLRVCSSGSAALPEETLLRWERATGCVICEGYGQTEAGPVPTYNPVNGPRKPGTVGPALPLTEIGIVDPESGTKVLPRGEVGEVRARGPQIMSGYLNRAAEAAETLRDGWLYTGDIGRLDEDGYLTICDRKKDMVITAGFNVYPREIEEALFTHPGVAEAAAIGIPDPYRGEVLLALVVRRDRTLSPEELLTHLADRLTKYKWPREIRFLDALPRTSVGKIDKAALRKMTSSQQA
jgi:long-chain acyl-CoA synthetase